MNGFLRLLGWATLAASAILTVVCGTGYWLYREATRPGPLAEPRTIVVPAHTGLGSVAALLAEEGVIRHRLSFELDAVLSGRGSALKAGEYEFPAGTSPLEAIQLLATGRTVRHRLTVPEGLTSTEVWVLVRSAPALEGDPGAPPPEGQLMPETYVYSYGEQRRTCSIACSELWPMHSPRPGRSAGPSCRWPPRERF
jgi:UPF0755 protein